MANSRPPGLRGEFTVVPSTHKEQLTMACTSSSRGYNYLTWPYAQRHTYIHTKLFLGFKKPFIILCLVLPAQMSCAQCLNRPEEGVRFPGLKL